LDAEDAKKSAENAEKSKQVGGSVNLRF